MSEDHFISKKARKATKLLIPILFALSIVFTTTYLQLDDLEEVEDEPTFSDLSNEEQVAELNNDYRLQLDQREYRLAIASDDVSRCEKIVDNRTREACFSELS